MFDAFVPHRPAPNLDMHSRQDYYLTYNLALEGDYRDQYFIDKRKNYPPSIERERSLAKFMRTKCMEQNKSL